MLACRREGREAGERPLDLAAWVKLYAAPMDGLLIGDVAARSGISRKALRLYESRGILPRARRTASGYRVYSEEVLGLLEFVARSRRLGLTLSQIAEIAAERRNGSAPCAHVRALLERKAADLTDLLAAVRAILDSWPKTQARHAAVCPHIERKGGDVSWKKSQCPSARPANTARRSSSTATRFGSVKHRI
jgi:MerR family transcriptional regulator, copper efflux regulator